MNLIQYIILFGLAFLPPIIYTIWIRNTEKFNREKWKSIILCFIWGSSIAVIAAVILEYILDFSLAPSINDQNSLSLVSVVIIAPFAEELAKPLALRLKTVKKELDEFEDGMIYGAVAGLGFSATENLLYGWDFMSEGLLFFFIFMIIRSFGGCLLHASATAWTGYGYGKKLIKNTSLIRVLPYFLLAILIHAFYNSLLSFDILGASIGLLAALAFTAISIKVIRTKIKTLDRLNNEGI
jgi:RsiW-degrading membrane proteinase PrsW (M82 family)